MIKSQYVLCFQEPSSSGESFYMIRDMRHAYEDLNEAILKAEDFAAQNPTKKVFTAKLVAVSGILNNVTTRRFK